MEEQTHHKDDVRTSDRPADGGTYRPHQDHSHDDGVHGGHDCPYRQLGGRTTQHTDEDITHCWQDRQNIRLYHGDLEHNLVID